MNEVTRDTPETGYADENIAGNALRAAREAAGLSIDAVSQQLKLAPRQVRALEDGNYEELPGRTFVRGFSRNYARLVHLDPDAVVAALPDPDNAPALDKPAIGITHRPIGELPATEASGGRVSRWLIPLVLIALVGVAVYEYTRAPDQKLFSRTDIAPAPAMISPQADKDPLMPPSLPGGGDATLLPNPLLPQDAPAGTSGEPAVEAPTTSPAILSPSVALTPELAPLPLATEPPAAPPEPSPPPAAPPPPEEATLVIAYRAPAWTEVRDATGQRLLVLTGAAGSKQTVTGKPPFELVLGNASETSVTWRGEPFDLAPHVQKNVARARLP